MPRRNRKATRKMTSDPPSVSLTNSTPYTLTTVSLQLPTAGFSVRQLDVATGIVTQCMGLTIAGVPLDNIEFKINSIRVWETSPFALQGNNAISLTVYEWNYPFQSGSPPVNQLQRPVYTREDMGGRNTFAKLQYAAKKFNKNAVLNGTGTMPLFEVRPLNLVGTTTLSTITMHVSGSYRFRLPTPTPALSMSQIFERKNWTESQQMINENTESEQIKNPDEPPMSLVSAPTKIW
jgi:hypothetical protein